MSAHRVWHIPQVPMKPFYVMGLNLHEAVLIVDVLANYDQFQLDNNVKGDYANASGIEELIDAEWCEVDLSA